MLEEDILIFLVDKTRFSFINFSFKLGQMRPSKLKSVNLEMLFIIFLFRKLKIKGFVGKTYKYTLYLMISFYECSFITYITTFFV